MKKSFGKLIWSLVLAATLTVASQPAAAQCAMCKAAPANNLNMGGKAARGLNNGILYMFATPYVVVGSIVFLWWYYRKEEDQPEVVSEPDLDRQARLN